MNGSCPIRAIVSLVVLALVAAGCEGGSTIRPSHAPPRSESRQCARRGSMPTRLDAAAESAPGVSRVDLVLVDPSRSTSAVAGKRGLPCRVLPVEVRYPTAANGARPLIVVAHGLDGDPTSLGLLLDAWSAAGYVVAAPTFPTTRKDETGTSLPSESADQAADVAFVLDRLLEPGRASSTTSLRRRIDSREIGVAGMSLGGQTVYGLIANTCCEDRRVRAAIVMAGVHREYPDGEYERNRMPVMLVQGDADSGYHNSVDAYPELAPPKWFVTLRGSLHSPPFESPLGPEAPLVRTTTIAFWDLYLKRLAGAGARLTQAVAAVGRRARLQRDER